VPFTFPIRPTDPPARRAARITLVYAATTFAWYCLWKYGLAERSPDPAIFENCLWNAVHGHGLRSSLEGSFPHLAVHFSPAIYLFLPFYALLPSMHVLHAAVCLGAGAAGYALFLEARERLDATTATLVMLAFLFHPTVVLQTFMEFHEQALAFLPIVLLVRSTSRGERGLALLAALLLLSLREDNAFFVLALGLLLAFRRGARALAAGLLALGASWLALYRVVAVGLLGHGELPNVFAHLYGLWGATPGDAVRAMLADPVRVVQHLLSRPVLVYLAQLLGPMLAFLPFGSSLVLAALPQALLVLLSDPARRVLHVRMHLSVLPATVAFVAALDTLGAIGVERPRLARFLAIGMLAVSLATVPVWLHRALGRFHPHREQALAVVAAVPETASVAAPDFLLNQMARRRQLDFVWGMHEHPTLYVILEEEGARGFEGGPIETRYTPATRDSLARLGFVPVYARGGYRVFRRGSPP
jgi:uncharacterized membrane protein